MHQVWILYYSDLPCNGYEVRPFDSQGEAWKYCRDNVAIIETAYFAGSSRDVDYIVRDGKVICADCGVDLLPTDIGVYPVCEACDVWEG